MRVLIFLALLVAANAQTGQIPVLKGPWPCKGKCEVDTFNLTSGNFVAKKVKFPSCRSMDLIAAHTPAGVHYMLCCEALPTKCDAPREIRRKVRKHGIASLTDEERRARAQYAAEAGVWSVVKVDLQANTGTVGKPLQQYDEALAAHFWQKTGELILLVANNTHLVWRAVDPTTGATTREITSWLANVENAFFHNTEIDQARGLLYADIGHSGNVKETDKLVAIDLKTGAVTTAWKEFTQKALFSRLSYDTGASPPVMKALYFPDSMHAEKEVYTLKTVDVQNKHDTPLGTLGTRHWILEAGNNAILPKERLWLQFYTNDQDGEFHMATANVDDGTLVHDAPWKDEPNQQLYVFLATPLLVKPSLEG